MAVYKGAAFASEVGALGTRFFSAALTSGASAPGTPQDHGTWEQDATAGTVTFVYNTTTTGLTPPGPPDSVTIGVYDGGGGTLIDEQTLATPADGATVSLNLTSTGTGAGAPLLGNLRLRIRAEAGGIGAYDVNSETQSKQGLVRANPTTLTLALATSGAGAPHTWPDTQTATVTQSHGTKTSRSGRSYRIRTRRSDLGADYKEAAAAAPGTGTTASLTARADYGYPQASTQVIAEAVVSVPSYVPDSEPAMTWIKVPSGSPQFVDGATMRTAAAAVDPRITVQALTRTSGDAVVNYGLHTVLGTFELHNARSEALNATQPAADRNLTVVSRDEAGSTNEGTISSDLAPNGAGLYSLSHSYTGPSSPASRGTGPNGDTAAHDLAGRAKTVHVTVNAGLGANNPTAIGASTLVSLSDLLRLDAHPQKTTTLAKDSDPFAEPGDAEAVAYVIGLDALQGFAYVEDVTGSGVAGVTVKQRVLDPEGNAKAEASQATQGAPNLGWTTTATPHDVDPPPGEWTFRALVDVDHAGAHGNYGPGANGETEQTVAYNSAYTADRAIALHCPTVVTASAEVDVRVEYLGRDATRYAFDAPPELRVYQLDGDGAQNEELAQGAMTQIGALPVYERTWTAPATSGTYLLEVVGDYLQSGVIAARAVTVQGGGVSGSVVQPRTQS